MFVFIAFSFNSSAEDSWVPLVQACRVSFVRLGWCHLPNFIHSALAETMALEALALESAAFLSTEVRPLMPN